MKLSRNQLAMANTLRMRAADHLVEAWRARRDLEAWRLPWFDAFELSAFIRQHLEAARRARRAEMALRNPVEF